MKSGVSVVEQGHVIASIEIRDNKLRIVTGGGKTLSLSDSGNFCCERRFMSTDDDLPYFVGAEYRGWELSDVESAEDEDGNHDIQFLVVHTSKGDITIANHNEHNGYYGGFAICSEWKDGAA